MGLIITLKYHLNKKNKLSLTNNTFTFNTVYEPW